jgi:hypothetical protein
MAAWTIKDRVRSVYTLGKYRLSASFVSSIVSSYNTFIASAGAKSDAQIFSNFLTGLDINTISGPEEIVAEDLIKALSTFINTYNVRNSANTADIGVDVAIVGTTPTGSGNGLARLNSNLWARDTLVRSANSLFSQKVPFLAGLCAASQYVLGLALSSSASDGTVQVRDFLNRLINTGSFPPNYSQTNGNPQYQCLERVSIIAYGGNAGVKTLRTDITTKTLCETAVTTSIAAMTSTGCVGNPYACSPRTFLNTGQFITQHITAEICAQFDIL